MIEKLQAGAIAFAATTASIILLRNAAPRLNLLDRPNGRKHHEMPTPVIGGIAIFIGLMAASVLMGNVFIGNKEIFLGMGLLLAVGVVDDKRPVSPAFKLLAQIAAASIIVLWGDVRLENLGNLFGYGDVKLGRWSVPLTVFAVVGVINALNMIDGADGLAGGVALIALLILFAFKFSYSHLYGGGLMALAFGVAAFMMFNMRSPWRARADVFLGDAGSMILGFVLAWATIDLAETHKVMSPITAVWILAVPLLDTVTLMIRRVMKGRSPLSPDREHLHHILMRAGYSHAQAVRIILLVSLLLSLVGVTGYFAGVPEYVMFYGFMCLFGLYFIGTMHAWRLMKLIRRLRNAQRPLVRGEDRGAA